MSGARNSNNAPSSTQRVTMRADNEIGSLPGTVVNGLTVEKHPKLGIHGETFYDAMLNDQMIGRLKVHPDHSVGNIFVDTPHRRQGIASALYDHAAKDRGVARLGSGSFHTPEGRVLRDAYEARFGTPDIDFFADSAKGSLPGTVVNAAEQSGRSPRPSLFPDEEMAVRLAREYPDERPLRGGTDDYWGTASAIARDDAMTYAPEPMREMINGIPRDPMWMGSDGRPGYNIMGRRTPANSQATARDRMLYEDALVQQMKERGLLSVPGLPLPAQAQPTPTLAELLAQYGLQSGP